MNVIYVIPYPRFFSQISNIGGHVAHVYGVVQALRQLGHNVTVYTEESTEKLDAIANSVVVLPCEKSNLLGRVGWSRRFAKLIGKNVANVDLVYMRYSVGFAPFVSKVKTGIDSVPLVLEVNSFLTQRKRLAGTIEKRFITPADCILTISEKNRNQMIEWFGEETFKKLIVVTNGVDIERYRDWEKANTRDVNDPIVFAYCGLVKDGYGLDFLLQSFQALHAKYKNVQFNLYGDGPYLGELKRRFGHADGIAMMGPKPFDTMPSIQSEIDVLVNSASHSNSFQSPTKMFEYMATGRPILSAKTPQCDQLLENGQSGSLYQIDDRESFLESAQWILDHPDEARRKAQRARKNAENKHCWTSKVKNVLDQVFDNTEKN